MNELKRKLDQVEADLRGLREDKATAGRKREEAKSAYAEVLANGGDEEQAHADAMEAVRSFGEIEDKIDGASRKQVELLKMLGDSETRDRTPESPHPTPSLPRSVEAALLDEGIAAALNQYAVTKSKFGQIDLGEIVPRDVLAAEFGGVMAADVEPPTMRYRETAREADIRPGRIPPIGMAVRDMFSFLNLIPVGTTDGNLVPYTQEAPITGGDSSAREVAEGDLKPEGEMNTWIDADAPVRTIAAWMKARKQVLSDVPALRSMIESRLRFLVQKRLAEQVLNGDGAGVNLEGILNTDGIGDIAYDANIPFSEAVLSGITAVYLNDGAADSILMNPLDWQTTLVEKAHNRPAGDTGSYEYIGGGPFGTTPSTLWGVRLLPTQVLDRGDSLVADFGLGAQLLIREGLSVLFSDSDQDDFLRNRVTMLAEMRAALLVWRPGLFQQVALA